MSTTLILGYHGVSRNWQDSMAVTPEQLEAQIAYLLGRGYVPTTFTRAIQRTGRRPTLAVTFDDGLLSVYRLALPILESLGVPATVFAPTSFIGGGAMRWPGIDRWQGTEHEQELTPMNWGDLRDLRDRGWEIGSHTCTHPRLTELTDAELRSEMVSSRAICEEHIGRECSSIAYPYGDHDQRVVWAAAAAGYAAGATLPRLLDSIVAPGSPLTVRRIGVYRRDHGARFRAKVSRTGNALADVARPRFHTSHTG